MQYDLFKPWKNLDEWQKKILNTKGSICLRSGRQVGKSTVISIKAGNYALKNPNKTVLVIASVERQAFFLFNKILNYLQIKNKDCFKTKATMTYVELTNGTIIRCLPAGDTGEGVRGYTVDLLIADEAAFINEMVWTALTPSLAVTRGDIWLLSTPHGRKGFYYRCFSDKKYTSFHISGEDCPRKDQDFLDYQKSWMTKAQYAQEHLGEFVDELQQWFSDELITKICTAQLTQKSQNRHYFLGVDIARMGKDESTFEILDGTNKKNIIQAWHEITRKTLTTQTTKKIQNLHNQWNFRNIGIDSGGVGAGVLDQLLQTKIGRKVIALNNASKSIDKDKRQKALLKEDMYDNLLAVMERSEITLLNNDEIKLSLKSIQYEYSERNKLLIHGSYSHIAEGLIRAVWCIKNKGLNIMSFC